MPSRKGSRRRKSCSPRWSNEARKTVHGSTQRMDSTPLPLLAGCPDGLPRCQCSRLRCGRLLLTPLSAGRRARIHIWLDISHGVLSCHDRSATRLAKPRKVAPRHHGWGGASLLRGVGLAIGLQGYRVVVSHLPPRISADRLDPARRQPGSSTASRSQR